MKLYRKAIADLIWEGIFAIAALRYRKTTAPAKPYDQADAAAASIRNVKGAKR